MDDKPVRLVTIATYERAFEAYLEKNILDDEGIPAVIADENIVSNVYTFVGAFGGVKLQVREEDAERATEILEKIRSARTSAELEEIYGEGAGEGGEFGEEHENDYDEEENLSEDEETETCPACGSDFVYREKYSPGCAFALMLFSGFRFRSGAGSCDAPSAVTAGQAVTMKTRSPPF